MREALTPERLRSRQARAQLLSRDINCKNSELADRKKNAHRADNNILRVDACNFRNSLLSIQILYGAAGGF